MVYFIRPFFILWFIRPDTFFGYPQIPLTQKMLSFPHYLRCKSSLIFANQQIFHTFGTIFRTNLPFFYAIFFPDNFGKLKGFKSFKGILC